MNSAAASQGAPDSTERVPACERGAHAPARFRLEGEDGAAIRLCLRHAVTAPRIVRTALPIAALVGTILTAINQGDQLVSGSLSAAMLWKIPLTYCVPYCVATVSALRVAQLRRHDRDQR